MKSKNSPLKGKINKKTGYSGNVIRTIFREELKEELQNFERNFERKIDQGLNQRFATFEVKMDFKFKDLENRVDDKARQYRYQVLTSNDKLAKTLDEMLEEIAIGNYQIREKLEDHEKRIKVLESA